MNNDELERAGPVPLHHRFNGANFGVEGCLSGST
jgi:hypothetical protein